MAVTANPQTTTTSAANAPQVRRVAAFLGRVPRRTETRRCPRRKGDCSSTSKSSRCASSNSWREGSSACGYNSSCEMVEPDFLAINTGTVVVKESRERDYYNGF